MNKQEEITDWVNADRLPESCILDPTTLVTFVGDQAVGGGVSR